MKKLAVIARILQISFCSLLIVAGVTAFAQSEADIRTMEKALALYSTGPIPGSISCTAVVDWDAFFTKMKIAETDDSKARVATLKTMKITVDTQDADHTEVKVDAPTAPSNQLADGLRMQLQGFFQMYWSTAYGHLVAKRGDTFSLVTTPVGYTMNTTSGNARIFIDLDKSYLVTNYNLQSPQLNAVMKPQFKPGEDGLLRLRNMDETIDMGQTRMVVSVAFDYQKVGVYDVPQHVTMGMPDSYIFDYTLTGCEVKGPEATKKP